MAEELAVLGEIAGEAAHELRNALAVIVASVPLLRSADGPAREAHIAKIERNARLAQCILDAMMALARGDEIANEQVLVARAMEEARREVKGTLSYEDEVDASLSVRGSAILLGRMFRVLYENAAEAGASSVSTHAKVDGASVVIALEDDGPGVPKERRDDLFNPLVTTKAQGTGLGLALARRVARAHGGDVTLTDPDGSSGARFRIVLRS
jgi:two-component system, NtrC family, sensor histidine kinase HydH